MIHHGPVIAGTISTCVFVASTMPMIIKAARTRDLSSYSGGNLVLSNVGNLFYAFYVFSLPVGPAWGLYGFNFAVSATMLGYWLRYRLAGTVQPSLHMGPPSPSRPAGRAGNAGLAPR